MCCEIRYAPNGIALHLNVRAQHLANQGLQTA
jgi:hypothetical protein